MTGEGTVVSVSDDMAVVRICKASACSHNCSECSACSNPSYETEVVNAIGAAIGDRVLIEESTGKILAISLLLYMLPVLLMLGAAAFCDAAGVGALETVIIFAVLMTVWFFLIRHVNKKFRHRSSVIQILK